MSQKKAKKERKRIKNLLKQMENQDKVQYSFKQLETLIQLNVFLTGEKPKKIVLVESFYNWYIQEVLDQAEAMGLQAGFKDDTIVFLGVLLEKRVKVETPKIVEPNGASLPKKN